MSTDAVRFEFGQNWAEYSKQIGDEELRQAITGVKKLLPDDLDPAGKSFLDIGSGSGLHAVAAHRLGFASITATDYDANSVSTTKANVARFNATVDAFKDDILNSKLAGSYDVVYSWGVLHHTGDMATAVANARNLVAPGGTFIVALYLQTQFCGMWRRIKRMYSSGGPLRQKLMATAYIQALRLRGLERAHRGRGMDFRHDAIDWLGGYPYESASPELAAKLVGRDFRLLKSFNTVAARGLFGNGCGEYVFRRIGL
jgi:2-polyprenyl-6-hydroxyphenyl methylase/3-demethylubiquinone-9 3-methyltransferase